MIPVKLEPSPSNEVAVTTPTIFAPPARTLRPALAVAIPIESTFFTSSYVKTPPTVTFPLNVPVAALSPLIVILGVPVNPCALVARVEVAAFPVMSSLAVINQAPFVS